MTPTFIHSGDIGDIIASLPSVVALGGGHYVITESVNGRRQSMRGPRFESIRPLLELQPYIRSVRWEDHPEKSDYDFTTFRHDGRLGEDLATWQARHLGVKISLDPWLYVDRVEHEGRVVIARSPRYHAPGFPWRELVARHRNPLFIGLPTEHSAFCAAFGRVEYLPTENMLDVARVIAGASLFIGNQSSPMWVALGLGVPILQETHPLQPNTMIWRSNCRYTATSAEINELWKELQTEAIA